MIAGQCQKTSSEMIMWAGCMQASPFFVHLTSNSARTTTTAATTVTESASPRKRRFAISRFAISKPERGVECHNSTVCSTYNWPRLVVVRRHRGLLYAVPDGGPRGRAFYMQGRVSISFIDRSIDLCVSSVSLDFVSHYYVE